MKLNIDAICSSGTDRQSDVNLVSVGGILLRDEKLSAPVEFDDDGTFYLLTAGRELLERLKEGFAIEDLSAEDAGGVVWSGGKLWLAAAAGCHIYIFRDGLTEQLGCAAMPGVQDISGRVQDDDILLVCSDGLSDAVGTDYLEHFLTNSVTPAEDLLDWAEEQGSTCSMGVIAARIGGGDFGYPDEGPDDDGRFDAWV